MRTDVFPSGVVYPGFAVDTKNVFIGIPFSYAVRRCCEMSTLIDCVDVSSFNRGVTFATMIPVVFE